MTQDITESVWLNTSDICSLEHIAEVSGLSQEDILDLVHTGVLPPSSHDRDTYFFYTECVVIAHRARRLRDDFELDTQGLAVAMRLLRRVDELETELANVKTRLLRARR